MTVATEKVVKDGVADAWNEYAAQTKPVAGTPRYAEVEPWAWQRLKDRLRVLGVRLDGEARGG